MVTIFDLKKKVSYIFLIMLLTLKESVLLLPKFYAPYIRRECKIKIPNNVRHLNCQRESTQGHLRRKKIPIRGCPNKFLSSVF